MKHKAFISYKHDSYSRAFAEDIENALKRYGLSLFKKPFSIFRDEKIIKPGDNLSAEIKKGLIESENLIFLGSAAAAQSDWVIKEIDYWFNELKREKIIVIIIEKGINYKITTDSSKIIDWENTLVIPKILSSFFNINTLFVDLSWAIKLSDRSLENPDFRRAINAISASLNNVEPSEMLDSAIIQYKKNKLYRIIGITLLTLTTFISIYISFLFNKERITSNNNRSSAISYLSQSIMDIDPTKAYQFAQTALNVNPNNEEAKRAIIESFYKGPFYNEIINTNNYVAALSTLTQNNQLYILLASGKKVLLTNSKGQRKEILNSFEADFADIEVSKNEKYIAISDDKGKVTILKNNYEIIDTLYCNDLISSMNFSLDENYIVIGSRDGSALLYEINSKESKLLSHNERVYSVSISSDNKYILTTGGNENAFLWNIKGNRIKTLREHNGPVVNGVFSANSSYMATAGFDNKVLLRNSVGDKIKEFSEFRNVSTVLKFSNDGNKLLFAGWEGKVYLYDILNEKLSQILLGKEEINACEFSPDGSIIAVADNKGLISLFNPNGDFISTLKGHKQGISSLSYSNNSKYLVSGGEDGTVLLWNLSYFNELKLYNQKSSITFMQISKDENIILLGDAFGYVTLLDANGMKIFRKKLHDGLVYKGIFATNNSFIATCSMDGTGCILSLVDTTRLYKLNHDADVIDISISNNNEIITAGYDNVAKIWNSKGQLLKPLIGHSDRLLQVGESFQSGKIVTASRDKSAIIWNRKGAKEKTLWHNGPVSSVNFGPISGRFITTERNSRIRLWSNNGDSLETFSIPNGQIAYKAIFSEDENYIATTTSINNIVIFDLNNKISVQLDGAKTFIKSFSFSNDSKNIIGSTDQNLFVWNLDGSINLNINSYNSSINNVYLSKNRSYILCAYYDGSLVKYNIDVNIIKNILKINGFTPNEHSVKAFER